jgi:hypothetical protein
LDGVRAEQADSKGTSGGGEPEEFGEECGGDGGVPFRVFASPPARIKTVTIWHRQYVDGIQLATEDAVLPRIGGTGRHHDVHTDTFELERDEIITGVSVECWTYIERITFHTNKRNYGPYGGTGGRVRKELTVPAGKRVVGFTGHHWEFVDSIQLMVS